LASRYGREAFATVDVWNDSIAKIISHRSVRKFIPSQLPEGTLELLIAAAQSAATSSNLQLWSVVAVEDADRRRALSIIAGGQAHVREAPVFLAWIVDLSRLARVAEVRGIEHEGLDYLEMFVMAVIDTALAAQNAVVAAESMGLGTVYIGALRNRPAEVAELLHLPPKSFAAFGLCVGVPDRTQQAGIKPRLPQSVVLHRETYGSIEDKAIDGYDQSMSDFYSEQGMNVTDGWSRHSARRVASPRALLGRERLREVLSALGFDLR